MRQLLVITLQAILLLAPFQVSAQKKELAQARTYIKSGKNLVQAEQMMEKLLKDSVNRKNKKIYLTLFDAIRKQYEQGNEQLYLKQKYDTASLFASARRMFSVLETLDSLDARPDRKGRVALEYRARHAEYLAKYRSNLFNGGIFSMKKNQFELAYDYFDCYIDCARQPLFEAQRFDSLDTRLPLAAYWTVFCGYQLHDSKRTLKYRELALRDTLHLSYVLQYLAETYKAIGNEQQYVETLCKGFDHEPEFPFFFPRLIDYYSSHNRLDSALCVTDKMLAVNDSNEIYLFAKSTVLLNMGKYAESIAICDSLIARNDSLPDAWLNAGLGYVNLAVETENVSHSRTKRRQVQALYQKARPYMERYRQLAPDEKDKWAPVLYNIYLNLNMGKQFDEVDKLLRQGGATH